MSEGKEWSSVLGWSNVHVGNFLRCAVDVDVHVVSRTTRILLFSAFLYLTQSRRVSCAFLGVALCVIIDRNVWIDVRGREIDVHVETDAVIGSLVDSWAGNRVCSWKLH